MYFFIAYQVITYIELHSEIMSYQRESIFFSANLGCPILFGGRNFLILYILLLFDSIHV